LFCKTGSEKEIAQKVNQIYHGVNAIAPMRVCPYKLKGKWEYREQALLPGYVFLFTEGELRDKLPSDVSNAYKLLEYASGQKELQGADYNYSMWVYRNHGRIDTSKVLTQGKRVKVIQGPLSDGFGRIVKLDRHKRRVWVEFDFDGQKRIVSLGAECVKAE